MTNKKFIEELKSYSAISLFFVIICLFFANNMTFAEEICKPFKKGEKFGNNMGAYLEICRKNNTTQGTMDIDGNIPVICDPIAKNFKFNPGGEKDNNFFDGEIEYYHDDYHYNKNNSACLIGAATIAAALSATMVTISGVCVDPKKAATEAKNGEKIVKILRALKVISKVIDGVETVAFATSVAVLAVDPFITINAQAAYIGAYIAIRAGILAFQHRLGEVATCLVGGAIADAVILAAYYAYLGTQFEAEKASIDKVKVCGYDWNNYVYTSNSISNGKIIEGGYPEYGSYSNSYSYKINKIYSGIYTCDGFVKYSGNNKINPELNSIGKSCKNNKSKSEANAAMRRCLDGKITDKNGIERSPSYIECADQDICRKFYARCEPIFDMLKEGFCEAINDDQKFCSDVNTETKSVRNRFFRELTYRGKEYKISRTYYDEEEACNDPRLPREKGYDGLEQRYYFKGKEAGNYACSRFDYKKGDCILPDGSRSSDQQKCAEEFEKAKSCCEQRRVLGICIYADENRDKNALCLRSGDSSGGSEVCEIPGVNGINPQFTAYQSEINPSDTCIRNVNFCPYSYNVAGGTSLKDLYCQGDYTNRSCGEYNKIWKKNAFKKTTPAYGQIKNFCFYRANCTETGETEYSFPTMDSNSYLPPVCSNFVGDSKNKSIPEKTRYVDCKSGEDDCVCKDGKCTRKIVEKNNSFTLKDFRGFSAPMAQCIRETIYNMFHNIAGKSICNGDLVLNSDGYCGSDDEETLQKMKKTKTEEEYNNYISSRYYQLLGEELSQDDNILYNIQKNVQALIKLIAALAIIVIGITFMLKGELDIFNDPKKPKLMIVGLLKFAIVFYFAVGDAWQKYVYDWIDKSTQYLYYKAYDLSLLDYKVNKNLATKNVCDIEIENCATAETSTVDECKEYTFTGKDETFTVPDGVTSIKAEVHAGGNGGILIGSLNVKPNDIITVSVGEPSKIGEGPVFNGGGEASSGKYETVMAGIHKRYQFYSGAGYTMIRKGNSEKDMILAGGDSGEVLQDDHSLKGSEGGPCKSKNEFKYSVSNGYVYPGCDKNDVQYFGCGGGSTNTNCSTKYPGKSYKGADSFELKEVVGGTTTQTVTVNYNSSNSLQEVKIPNGTTKAIIELYGANGGDYPLSGGGYGPFYGGKGGYAKGELKINGISSIFVGIGGKGGDFKNAKGGTSASECLCNGGSSYNLGGGGACSCVIANNKKVIITGGGGGASSYANGGNGGGLSGDDSCETYSSRTQNYCAAGGSQTTHGQPYVKIISTGNKTYQNTCDYNNIQGYGCSRTSNSGGQSTPGGAGGGGYYGGGMQPYTSYSAGGGGSGYIDSSMISNGTMTNGGNASSDGNGYAVITFTVKTPAHITKVPHGGAGGGGYIGGAGGSTFLYGQSNQPFYTGGGGAGFVGSNFKDVEAITKSSYTESKAKICYTQTKLDPVCSYEELPGYKIEDLNIFESKSLPTSNYCKEDSKTENGVENKITTCYNNCRNEAVLDENGNIKYDFSDKYDGCYFGDEKYPEGKEYLSIFDSLDCKLSRYYGYGPEADVPGILHMVLLSLIWSPLGLLTFICGFAIFVILACIVINILYIFLMSILAINLLIYVSPIIFPTLLFKKYEKIFSNWMDLILSFFLQFMFVAIYAGFLISTLDKMALGSATYTGHDASGRLPSLVCSDTTDSLICALAINPYKGTEPALGEKLYKWFGLGPMVYVSTALSQNFTGTLLSLFEFALISYVLLQFLKKIPELAKDLTNGGTALTGKDVSAVDTLQKGGRALMAGRRLAVGLIKKGRDTATGLYGSAKNKINDMKEAGANRDSDSGQGMINSVKTVTENDKNNEDNKADKEDDSKADEDISVVGVEEKKENDK